ncbi:MAG: BtaA family protein [Planctomycetaceae bacterium]|jgi:S-adenosylmethionine-diacylglycerol 3-amino-3-carboxypropyl transferase|nr:BtaA family protein [Planctomycetaceae bacterium]
MNSVGEWISGRVFNYVHGNNLVYNTCWEDPRLDKTALELTPDDSLLVITSAGCNALSYALTGLKHVYAVDMNPRQNALLDLKIAGIKNLDYWTFFRMFGIGRLDGVKAVYRAKLRNSLSDWSRKYWDKKIVKYFGGKCRSFYFCGTSGTFARMFNIYLDRVAKIRPEVNAILEAKTIDEQKEIWYDKIRERLWSRLVKYMMDRDTTLSMLGVPRAQRMQIDKQYEGGIVRFIQDCLDAIFAELPTSDNYFWHVYATGSYTPTCCPEYLEEKNFNLLKSGLVDRVSTHTDTVEGFLQKNDVTISRFVLLDHQDWLSDRYYDALVAEWDAILKRAADQTRILWRSGGLCTDYIDTVPVEINGEKKTLNDILVYHKDQAAELHKKCRVHTYGSFYIADLKR